jgi:hypothetical protein
LLVKSRSTLTDCTFWTFEDVLLPALKYSVALKRLILENYFTLKKEAFEALKTLNNLEDLQIKAENVEELAVFINENLLNFQKLKKLTFNCRSREDYP